MRDPFRAPQVVHRRLRSLSKLSRQFVVLVSVRSNRWPPIVFAFGGAQELAKAVCQVAGVGTDCRVDGQGFYHWDGTPTESRYVKDNDSHLVFYVFRFSYDNWTKAVTARRRLEARYNGWTATMREAITLEPAPLWVPTEVK